jgi:hypothetical protein
MFDKMFIFYYKSESISPISSFDKAALKDANWHHSMPHEYNALKNETWWLIPRPAGADVVIGKWIFRHK